jgi:hypothetical protein
VLQEIQGRRKINAISYNKLGHITRGLLPDSKAKKKILVKYKKFERIFNNVQNKDGLLEHRL